MTDLEMKYIGWNLGAIRMMKHQNMYNVDILELKINGIDILPLLRKYEIIKLKEKVIP